MKHYFCALSLAILLSISSFLCLAHSAQLSSFRLYQQKAHWYLAGEVPQITLHQVLTEIDPHYSKKYQTHFDQYFQQHICIKDEACIELQLQAFSPGSHTTRFIYQLGKTAPKLTAIKLDAFKELHSHHHYLEYVNPQGDKRFILSTNNAYQAGLN